MKKELNVKQFKIESRLENFIWCSGRSGSTSLYNSLPNCYHTHTFLYFLNQNGVDWNNIEYNYKFNLFDILNINIKDYNSNKINIFDVYRTPIERKISAFFQYLDCVLKNKDIEVLLNEARNYQEFYSFDIGHITSHNFVDYFTNKINHLIELFLYFFFLRSDNYYSFLEFEELIDLSFDCKNFHHVKNDKFTFTILKYDQIENWSEQIFNTTSQKIKIMRINSSKNTSFGFLYKEFIKNLQIPKVLFEIVMYNDLQMHPLIPICNHSDVMKKFMNYDEICSYKIYWNERLFNTKNDFLLSRFAEKLL